ncbi:MAG: HDOD domain-containing protein [Oligoflexales bacterium]|nr:HDOD domain-containing protein [Oligoflexales bacterium]
MGLPDKSPAKEKEQFDAKKCNGCGRVFSNVDHFLTFASRFRICESGNLWLNCTCKSTLMIPKGKYSWYSPSMKMSENAKTIFNKLSNLKELPHIPTFVMELQQLIQNKNTTSKALADASKKDPLITAKILEMANHLKPIDDGRAIESLSHAISYIGIQALSEIVTTASLRCFIFESKIFNADDFWKRSTLTGRIAEHMAKTFLPKAVSYEIYLSGALCNLGKVIMAIGFPDMADKIAKDMKDPTASGSWLAKEKLHGAYSHTVLGEIGASFWGLPEYAAEAAAEHHEMISPKEKTYPITALDIIKLANQITHLVEHNLSQIDRPQLLALSEKFKLADPDLLNIAQKFL